MNAPQQEKNITTLRQKTRKKIMFIFCLVFIIAAVASGCWLYLFRAVQSTDDAYIMGNKIAISSQVAGSVISVHYKETDRVLKGDVLVTLDDTDARINYRKAIHNLADSVRKIKQLYINDDQYAAAVRKSNIVYQQTLADFQRRKSLAGVAAISKEELQHARNAVIESEAALDVAREALRSNHALIAGTVLEKHPEILQAADSVREAWISLQRTRVVSPVTGYVAQRNVQVGETLTSGQSVLSVVPADDMWVEANFKETQLSGIKIGQDVSVVTDLYGSKVMFNGKVEGISMGTGSAFSILPAQNATGNWIKVVQRLPVRIRLDPQQVNAHPLRIGLSTTVTLHETHTGGESLATAQRISPAWHSDALVIDTTSIDNDILAIIQANAR